VIVAVLIILFVALILYQVWAQSGIYNDIKNFRIQDVGVVRLRCNPERYWGHIVLYKRMTDDYERSGYVCRDWKNGIWILVE
jgi:hypothetical protein